MTDERFDFISDIYERMHGDARMRTIDADLLDVKSPESLAKAREFVNNIIAQGVMTQRQLAKRTGSKPTAISTFLSDKWVGRQGTLYSTATDLCRAINDYLKQTAAEDTAVGGYVTTRFTDEVWALAQYVMKRKMMGAFVAPAGSGKSTVLGVLRDDIPGAILVVGQRTRASVKAFLQLLARELGLPEQGRAEDLQDRIVTCLQGSGRLVCIDECHKLQVATLDVVREIWDATKVPVLLAGTPSFHTVLTTRRVGVATSELMDQLYSRVGIYRDLTSLENPETGEPDRLYTPEDIRKVFGRGKLRLTTDATDFLCRLANSTGSGGLRACSHLVQVCVDMWPGEPICAQYLRTAMRMKIGGRQAAFRMDQAGLFVQADQVAAVAAG